MYEKANVPVAQANEHATNNRFLTPREARVLTALVHTKDWVTREAIDRIARCSNGPALVQILRRKLGHYDAIEMQRVPVIDADGQLTQPGRYRLSEADRCRAVALLNSSQIT